MYVDDQINIALKTSCFHVLDLFVQCINSAMYVDYYI